MLVKGGCPHDCPDTCAWEVTVEEGRAVKLLGARRLARTICGDTANAAVVAALGTPTGLLPEDVEHSRLIVLWGTNTLVTNLHLWPLIRRARAAGAKLVVIDPLRTRTAQEAD